MVRWKMFKKLLLFIILACAGNAFGMERNVPIIGEGDIFKLQNQDGEVKWLQIDFRYVTDKTSSLTQKNINNLQNNKKVNTITIGQEFIIDSNLLGPNEKNVYIDQNNNVIPLDPSGTSYKIWTTPTTPAAAAHQDAPEPTGDMPAPNRDLDQFNTEVYARAFEAALAKYKNKIQKNLEDIKILFKISMPAQSTLAKLSDENERVTEADIPLHEKALSAAIEEHNKTATLNEKITEINIQWMHAAPPKTTPNPDAQKTTAQPDGHETENKTGWTKNDEDKTAPDPNYGWADFQRDSDKLKGNIFRRHPRTFIGGAVGAAALTAAAIAAYKYRKQLKEKATQLYNKYLAADKKEKRTIQKELDKVEEKIEEVNKTIKKEATKKPAMKAHQRVAPQQAGKRKRRSR